ncbi:hypothetical protein [Delftia lacustris]|uniref:hypothetical protein n=1 Tax=Delftia lacustris TaxID=558537 RepID=UPI001FCE2618|nr:hypothetical protein [Delftia lacustris]BDE75221.1 hypothetical protein HQS1_63450 [Delftia lacustris]
MSTAHDDHELLPGLVVPPAFHGTFRKRLAEVGTARSATNCLIAQARAEGLVEALETVTHGINPVHIERLYLLIEQAATARLQELQ